MGSIIGHGIDYNGVGSLRGQRHIPSKNGPKLPPRGIAWGDISTLILRFKRKRANALLTSLEIFAHTLVSSSFVDEEVSQRKLSSASRSKVACFVC